MSSTFQNNPRMVNPQLDRLRQSMGLQRAHARDVPEGYEQDSNWTADLAGADPTSLLRIYAQRERDRLTAQDQQARQDYYAPGSPMTTLPAQAQQMPNMAGFFEGTQYNDAARGIDPETGDVTAAPKRARINTQSLTGLRTHVRGR